MKVEQIYTGCLAQGAYYIQSGDEVAIIDPLREVQSYVKKAEKNKAKIKYIFETHFHADFVSGHLDLARKTNAPIIFGPNANPSFDAIIAKDGQIFELGNLKIKVLHTPGHTMESSCFLLFDENNKEYALFSGDTLFIGDVGRPDLAQKSDLSMQDLAGFLYDSLQNKILPLPDSVIVYPAHGAGSACGKNMSKETFDSLGHQKLVNYALQPQSKNDFVKAVTDGLLPPPFYFPKNVLMNKNGYENFEKVLSNGKNALTPDEFEMVVNAETALVLDTRIPDEFQKGFIPNAINIGIKGDFAPWVGTLITDIQQPILLVVDEDKIEEVLTRLSRVGYDNTLGYLAGGMEAWQAAGKEIDVIEAISAEDLVEKLRYNSLIIKDVRKNTEYEAEHIKGAANTPLAYLNEHLAEFSKDKINYIHCAGGYRSMIACSILKARGFDNIVNIEGGMGEVLKTNIEKSSLIMEGNKEVV